MVLLVHTPTGLPVDLSLGIIPLEEQIVRRAQPHVVNGVEVLLPTPEDLIIMKALAARPGDWEDITAVARVHPDLRVACVRRWVQEIGRLLDAPWLWPDTERAMQAGFGPSTTGASPRRPRPSQDLRRTKT